MMAQTQYMAAQVTRDEMIRDQTKTRTMAAPVAHSMAAIWGMVLVEGLIGYEWLLSGLNKLLSPTFRSGLTAQIQMALHGNPNTWWVALTRRLVLPQASLWGLLVEVGELLVALGFFAGAVLWASGQFPTQRWARRLNLGVLAALVGSALMTANYYLMSGETLPGINPGNPFNEGLGIDGLLTLVAAGLFVIHAIPLWAHRTRRSGSADAA